MNMEADQDVMPALKTRTFLELVQPHVRRMYVVARQYVSGADEANDLVQESLLRAWRSFSLARGRTYQRAWLFTILRNVAREWHRAGKRRVRLVPCPNSELTEIASSDPGGPFCQLSGMDESRFREFLDDRIVAALEALEPRFREVVVLSVAGGLSYREIAEVLGCPVGTVMSRMARARRTLREQLAEFAQPRRRARRAEHDV
jgi:RNA polymerase sigma-70 factor (ECF subfamily)